MKRTMTFPFDVFAGCLLVSALFATGCASSAEDDDSSTDYEESAALADHQAMATHFDGLGTPYGGCGVPESVLETGNFVALNVQNTPHDYRSMLPRPIQDAAKRGEFNNGNNCGRWVRVTLGDHCTGLNDGAPGLPFCRNGRWAADKYNGATLDLLVTDSCQDGNAWCRDDRYHLDLSTASVNRFKKNGSPVGDLLAHWDNRKIAWHYIDAPNYSGDIRIGFRQGATHLWPAITITHLPSGIHGVKAEVNGAWVDARRLSDNGQAFELPVKDGAHRIKVIDANGAAIFGGRIYEFSFPSSCGQRCSAPFAEVRYTTH